MNPWSHWLSNLMKLLQFINICMKNASFTLQTTFPWLDVWFVHSCWPKARTDTCRCRYEGAWALSLLRRIKWCSTKDTLELHCECNESPYGVAYLMSLTMWIFNRSSLSNKGSLRRVFRGLLMWRESGILFIIGVLTRSSYSPCRASRTRAANSSLFSFLYFPFSLSHTCSKTHSTHAPVGSSRVNAMRSIPDSNAHFIAPMRAAYFSVFNPAQFLRHRNIRV